MLGDQPRQVVYFADLLVELVQLFLELVVIVLDLVILLGQEVVHFLLVAVSLLDDLLQDHLLALQLQYLLV